eukprot:52829-Rhodomonas_salina.1
MSTASPASTRVGPEQLNLESLATSILILRLSDAGVGSYPGTADRRRLARDRRTLSNAVTESLFL